MARTRRSLKTKGTDIPPLKSPPSRTQTPLSEEGLLTFAEIAIGTLIIALLLVVGVFTLRVTERGTISEKKRQQALDLAKGKAEELKSILGSMKWDNMKVDVRFPNVTPAATPYNMYPPVTITLGYNKFIVDPEVRYAYLDVTGNLQVTPTPANSATPEYSQMVRIRVDAYYGPLAEFIPLPTAEIVGNLANRMVFTNALAKRDIYVAATGTLNGYVQNGCPGAGVGGVDVGVFQGSLKIADAISSSNGYYYFSNIPSGNMSISIVSSPGYNSLGPCNFTNPVSIPAGGYLVNQNLVLSPLTTWNYQGVVVYTTPVITTVPPTSPTPTPNPTAIAGAVPIPGAIVFADDGNSLPVTSNALGQYLITNVRATPVAGHNFDTLEADAIAATLMGKNYNVGPAGSMYPPCGPNCIGPITIFMQAPLGGTIPVDFVVQDETGANILNCCSDNFYPISVYVADGSSLPPSGAVSNAGVNTVTLNVHPGNLPVSMLFQQNASPPAWSTFNQSLILLTPQVVTLPNYAVGSMSGTVAGMGASFDYSQFRVRAHDAQGQFSYDVPVSYNGSATFGTFSKDFMRCPLPAADLTYYFIADGGSDFTSTQEQKDVQQGVSRTLDNPILVSLLNVYMAVTVTQAGGPYPYGSWVSAIIQQPAPTPTPSLPVTQGSNSGLTDYFSTVTGGDGTANLQVQLKGGTTTNYTVYAQITDPNKNYAVTTISTTVSVDTTNTTTNPKGVTFNF